jgi:hypothetical protein
MLDRGRADSLRPNRSEHRFPLLPPVEPTTLVFHLDLDPLPLEAPASPAFRWRSRMVRWSTTSARLRTKDESFRRSAEHVVKRDYGVKKIKSGLDDKDTAAFWNRVAAAIEIGFAGEE